MQKRKAISSARKKDYMCRSFHKNDSEQSIRIHFVQMMGKYILQQEESKSL